MDAFTHGLFLGKIPYAKSGTGPKKAVIFQGSIDLILSIALDPGKRDLTQSATLDSIVVDSGHTF